MSAPRARRYREGGGFDMQAKVIEAKRTQAESAEARLDREVTGKAVDIAAISTVIASTIPIVSSRRDTFIGAS